jgi:hypothetical protein
MEMQDTSTKKREVSKIIFPNNDNLAFCLENDTLYLSPSIEGAGA